MGKVEKRKVGFTSHDNIPGGRYHWRGDEIVFEIRGVMNVFTGGDWGFFYPSHLVVSLI